MAVGVASPKSTAGNNQHGHGIDQTGPEVMRDNPAKTKGQHGQHQYGGHKYSRYAVGQTLHAGLAALCLLHHAHNARKYGLRAHLGGLHTQYPGLVERTCKHAVPCGFGNGSTFPR